LETHIPCTCTTDRDVPEGSIVATQ